MSPGLAAADHAVAASRTALVAPMSAPPVRLRAVSIAALAPSLAAAESHR
jgi:hypothetical protein